MPPRALDFTESIKKWISLNTTTVLLFISLSFLIIALIMLFRKKKSTNHEGFDNNAENYMYGEPNLEVFNKPSFKILTTEDSLTPEVDKLLNRRPKLEYSFKNNVFPGWHKLNAECSEATEPKFLPPRDVNKLIGCGWWYSDDDYRENTMSIGQLGNRQEPVNKVGLEKTHPGGVWMWDLAKAQKMEEDKICSRIKICELADLMPGKCGFCPSLKKGIPVDSAGLTLYPDEAHMSCPEDVITNVYKCPRLKSTVNAEGLSPEQQQQNINNGLAPGQIGAWQGGDVISSEDDTVSMICEPNITTGKLSGACLIKIAKGLGFTEEGALIRILMGDPDEYMNKATGNRRHKFRIAKDFLYLDHKLESKDAFFGRGVCTRFDAMKYYYAIKNIMYSGSTNRAKEAAGFIFRNANFDECFKAPAEEGPYELHCVQRVALENGFQPDGTLFPKINSDLNRFEDKKWSDVRSYYSTKAQELKSNNKEAKRLAVKEVLGISVTHREVSIVEKFGDIDGFSFYIYEKITPAKKGVIGSGGIESSEGSEGSEDSEIRQSSEDDEGSEDPPFLVFVGRRIKSSFSDIATDRNFFVHSVDKTKNVQRLIKYKGQLVSQQPITTKFWVYNSDKIGIFVNGSTLLNIKNPNGDPAESESKPFQLNMKNGLTNFEIDWTTYSELYNFSLRWWYNNKFDRIPPSVFYQNQPRKFPIVRWDFYQGTVEDRCKVLSSKVIGDVPIIVANAKRCALFRGPENYILIKNGISSKAFISITMMVNVQSMGSNTIRLWEFNNNTPIRKQDSLCGVIDNSNHVGIFATRDSVGPQLMSSSDTKIDIAKWVHLAWVFYKNKIEVYLNGRNVITYSNENIQGLDDKIYTNMYIANSDENYDKNIAIAWFRIFDYKLAAKEVRQDMDNKFAIPLAFPTNPGCGF